MSKNTSSRGYIITLNNPKVTKEMLLEQFIQNYEKTLKYCVLSLEKGDSGTKHIQGYAEFKSPVPFASIKSFIPEAHLEPRKGSPLEASEYVKGIGKHKDKSGETLEGAIEHGELPVGQGKRSDLDVIAEMLIEGATPETIMKVYPSQYLRLRTHIRTLHQEIQEEKYKNVVRDLDVFFITGGSRTGKTSGVYNYFGFENAYRVTNYDHPYDGYECQDILILEEFHGQLQMSELLQLLEGYPMKLRARYYDRQAAYTKVMIITNKSFNDLYPALFHQEPKIEAALRNRISKMITINKLGQLEQIFKDYYESPF